MDLSPAIPTINQGEVKLPDLSNQGIEFAHKALTEYRLLIAQYERLSSVLGFIRRRDENFLPSANKVKELYSLILKTASANGEKITPASLCTAVQKIHGERVHEFKKHIRVAAAEHGGKITGKAIYEAVKEFANGKIAALLEEKKRLRFEWLPDDEKLAVLEAIKDVLPTSKIAMRLLPSARSFAEELNTCIRQGREGKPIEIENNASFLKIAKRALRRVPRAKVDAALFRYFIKGDEKLQLESDTLKNVQLYCVDRIQDCDKNVSYIFRRGINPKTAHEKVRQMARTYFRARAIQCVSETEWGRENFKETTAVLTKEPKHALTIIRTARKLGLQYEENAEENRLKDLIEANYTGMRWQFDIIFAKPDSEPYLTAVRDYGDSVERMYNKYNSYARHKRDAAALGGCLIKLKKQAVAFWTAKTLEEKQTAASELLPTVDQMNNLWDHTNFNLKKSMMNNLNGIRMHLLRFQKIPASSSLDDAHVAKHAFVIRKELIDLVRSSANYLSEVHHLVFPWGNSDKVDPSLLNKSGYKSTENPLLNVHAAESAKKMAYVIDFPDVNSLAPGALELFEQIELKRLVKKVPGESDQKPHGQKALLTHVDLESLWTHMRENAGSFIGVISEAGRLLAGCVLERKEKFFSDEGKIAVELASDIEDLKGCHPMFISIVAAEKGVVVEAPEHKNGVVTALDMIFEETDAFSPHLDLSEPYPVRKVAVLFMVREGHIPNLASESYLRCGCVPTEKTHTDLEFDSISGTMMEVPYRLWYRISRESDLALVQAFEKVAA